MSGPDHSTPTSGTPVERWTAFSSDPDGGNPAGVWIGPRLPTRDVMQRIAAEVGYSETAFLETTDDPGRWVVRYLSPVGEIPVAMAHDGDRVTATLTSVEPQRRDLAEALLDEVLDAMFLTREHLDADLCPDLAYAGAWHLVLALRSRDDLACLRYDFDRLAHLMTEEHLTTVQVIWREHPARFHARNPFPVGGIVEDPATGAAAAALGGYLRAHHHLDPPTNLTIVQGVDMGRPSIIAVHVRTSGGIGVTGTATEIPPTP